MHCFKKFTTKKKTKKIVKYISYLIRIRNWRTEWWKQRLQIYIIYVSVNHVNCIWYITQTIAETEFITIRIVNDILCILLQKKSILIPLRISWRDIFLCCVFYFSEFCCFCIIIPQYTVGDIAITLSVCNFSYMKLLLWVMKLIWLVCCKADKYEN